MAKNKSLLYAKRILLILALLNVFQVQIMPQGDEYLVKAAYIEKFARFTEWPKWALEEKFVIAVIGKDPFNGALKEIWKKEKINGLPVEVKYISGISDLDRCNILFISRERNVSLNQILSHIGNKPILTVSDSKDFCEKGVHFNFYFTAKGTIHFEVNPVKIKKSGLNSDLYLLEFGKKVGG